MRAVKAWLPLLLVLVLAGAFAAWALRGQAQGSQGVLEPVWDRQPCSHCAMLLAEHGYAAQLHLTQGPTLFFDDPGCLLEYRHSHPEAVGQAFYHHRREERWLPEAAVGWVTDLHGPMAYGIAAVDQASAGSHTLAWAQQEVAHRRKP